LYLLFFYYNLKQENGIKQTLADRKIEKERGRERGGGREREREGERERERERGREKILWNSSLSAESLVDRITRENASTPRSRIARIAKGDRV